MQGSNERKTKKKLKHMFSLVFHCCLYCCFFVGFLQGKDFPKCPPNIFHIYFKSVKILPLPILFLTPDMIYKGVEGGGGPKPDRQDRLERGASGQNLRISSHKICLATFGILAAWRSKTGPQARLDCPGFADALDIYVS